MKSAETNVVDLYDSSGDRRESDLIGIRVEMLHDNREILLDWESGDR
ncbi:MAG: hypothetical protein ACSLFQ_05235 [Thermoanaerobaculia bacterium]